MSQFTPKGLGWHPDLVDYRDYELSHPSLESIFIDGKIAEDCGRKVDLRDFFMDVEDQGETEASCAFACGALAEYFNRRVGGSNSRLSKWFLHDVARKFQSAGRNGLQVGFRATFKALTRIGIPPESYVSRETSLHDPFLYLVGRDYEQAVYVRLDSRQESGPAILANIKSLLAAGWPVLLGIPILDSLTTDPLIPYRPYLDRVIGGHGVVAVGFDDSFHSSCVGALLIRSSWGTQWGETGYGWLPYRFIEQGIANNVWALFSREWAASDELLIPRGLAPFQIGSSSRKMRRSVPRESLPRSRRPET